MMCIDLSTNPKIVLMQQEIFLRMVLDAWYAYLRRADDLFNELSDEKLSRTIAPGKNTGKYLLGHLTTVHDHMIPLLGFGNPLYPELYDPFEIKADGEQVNQFATTALRECWTEVNNALKNHFARLTLAQWFERHNAVAERDFENEPHRNKLNVVINRTNHLAWHYGQLLLLKESDKA
jgi:hypothetical protein